MSTRTALLPLTGLSMLLLCAGAARAADEQTCSPATLATLGRQVKVAHFTPAPSDFGTDPKGVILAAACKRLPNDPRLTLVAAAWDAGQPDSKALVLALVDESTSTVAASTREDIDEDATTRVHNASLRLDTAAYELAPGVRAVGLDLYTDNPGCGDGGFGPHRTLYVRDGATLRPVVAGLAVSQFWYLRGNQPRCVQDPKEAETPITEDFQVTVELGKPGKGGWRDLVMTATSTRSDHGPARKPLHVRVPYDGDAYPLVTFAKAYDAWRK